MALLFPKLFQSPSNSGRAVRYVQLNAGAKHTLLYCYGAGGDSTSVAWYQEFTAAHPDLSILCVDRWTQGHTAAQSGPELLSELSFTTIELLDSLQIDIFSITAHSAGAYQCLDLAARCPSRVKHIFPMCTHIPAPFTGSKIMSSMCEMPDILFRAALKVDGLGDTQLERLFLKLMGSRKADREDYEKFVGSKQLKEVLDAYKPDEKEMALRKKRNDLDYRIGYCRIPGINMGTLISLYSSCTFDITWFSCVSDIFFGPASVQRIAKEMKSSKIEMIVVEEASHADIFVRTEVWNKMYEQISKE